MRKLAAEESKCMRGYRAIALTSVIAKWYALLILVLMLEKIQEQTPWSDLHVERRDGVCAYSGGADEPAAENTGNGKKKREGTPIRGAHKYNTVCMASLNIKTVFVVAQPTSCRAVCHAFL